MNDLIYLKTTTSSPYEIKVHWVYCRQVSSSVFAKPFVAEEWPPSSDYYIVGCSHCRPFEDKRKTI